MFNQNDNEKMFITAAALIRRFLKVDVYNPGQTRVFTFDKGEITVLNPKVMSDRACIYLEYTVRQSDETIVFTATKADSYTVTHCYHYDAPTRPGTIEFLKMYLSRCQLQIGTFYFYREFMKLYKSLWETNTDQIMKQLK